MAVVAVVADLCRRRSRRRRGRRRRLRGRRRRLRRRSRHSGISRRRQLSFYYSHYS